jgi:DNA-binding IclR family transcriptional regulator
MTDSSPQPRTPAAGAQTLARGIAALQLVATTPDGLSIQDVADSLGIHRTIAYRMLATLADAHLVSKGDDGRYRGAAGLLTLTSGAFFSLRNIAQPIMRRLAASLASTVSLLVRQGDEAVALAVVEPQNARYHIAFAEGSRHPLDRGAAGHALRASLPASDADSDVVRAVRAAGYARTFGEVEPGAYGLAVPCSGLGFEACLNLITYREDVAVGALERMIEAARAVRVALEGH